MRILATLITITALGLSITAIAAEKKNNNPKLTQQSWEKEPDSFLGISLSSAVDGISSCPYIGNDIDFATIQQSGKVCAGREHRRKDHVELVGLPKTGFPYDVTVEGWEQGIAYFYLKTEPEHFHELVKLFVTRYGAPTKSETETVKTKGGAEFSNELLYWSGKSVSIVLERYDGDINTSTAMISNRSYLNAEAEKRKKKLTEDAEKF